MSIAEFDSYEWRAELKARWKEDGEIHPVAGVDFSERLVGLKGATHGSREYVTWTRCENITIVE